MHTYAIQALLHFQSAEPDEHARIDAFLSGLQALARAHGMTFDDYQSIRLPSDGYRIRRCDRCGDLTVNKEDLNGDIENVLPDFWAFVRRGRVDEQKAVCDISELRAMQSNLSLQPTLAGCAVR
jgi:hypothetical protein